MRHMDVERWSRGTSVLHRWDARMKVIATLAVIGAIGATRTGRFAALGGFAALLFLAALLSRIPLMGLLVRGAVVLPFSIAFSAISLLAGDANRAIAIPLKSYLSCLAALLLIGTTTLPAILRALNSFRVPRIVLFVTQFVYRYLFVLFEQAAAMKRAANCRAGTLVRNRSLFRAAAGTLAVLFGKSYDRAEGIHNAMISRGFTGSITALEAPSLRLADVAAAGGVAALLVLTWILL